jgi:hypothetical protein
MGFTRKHVNALVKGTAAIEPGTALKLESVLGSTAKFWLTREVRYREALARRQELKVLERDLPWLSTLPVADMVRYGWIRKWTSRTEQLAECLRFFSVASVEAWNSSYGRPLAAFRASHRGEAQMGAVAAWLRQGERMAGEVSCGGFDATGFRRELLGLRSVTLQSDPAVFVPVLKQSCAKHGVAVVFVPPPKGCPAFGATRWLSPGKAVLQLSLRGKANDLLWFTFFHEAAHILLHGKRLLFLEGTEGLDPKLESEADGLAAELLVPQHYRKRLTHIGVSKESVVAFANEVGVAPGIVVGRLQREGLVKWDHLNGLKVYYRWKEQSQGSA